ncbi:hypothetical protein KP014_17430 [Paenibacillus sophorae]|nr:hypothetical protein [Paenibacillus sophorae]QWU13753.1 hypothetical protein KP014_17430 [Paenibacillus sophorae]
MNEKNRAYYNQYLEECDLVFGGRLTGNELVKFQNGKLQEILEYVYANSSYYQKALAPYSGSFDSITIDTMNNLPFTTKETLREADMDILSLPINEMTYYYETTGTTGKSTPCPRSMIEVMSSNITISLAYKKLFEEVFGDYKPVVGVFGPTEIHSFGDSCGNICHNLDLCVVKAWPYSQLVGFKKALELMEKLNIEVIMCTPGLAMTLYKAAKHYGYVQGQNFNVKMLMLTGEICTESMIHNISTLWGAKVFNFLYGSQETLVMATCNYNNKMNIFPHNYIYEVVKEESDEVIGFEGEGELVVTMLNPGGKPLIRYRTGDLVRIENNPLSPIPTFEIEVLGRVKDKIQLNSRKFCAADIERVIMSDLVNCIGYQITITRVDGADYLEVRLEMSEKEHEQTRILSDIEARIWTMIEVNSTVEFSDGLSTTTFTGALVSWKAARIVDKRKQDSETEAAQKVVEDQIVKNV